MGASGDGGCVPLSVHEVSNLCSASSCDAPVFLIESELMSGEDCGTGEGWLRASVQISSLTARKERTSVPAGGVRPHLPQALHLVHHFPKSPLLQ